MQLTSHTYAQHTRKMRWPDLCLLLLLCIPVFHTLLLVGLDSLHSSQARLVHQLRPLGTLGSMLLLFYVGLLSEGRRRWAWAFQALAMLFSAIFSFLRVSQHISVATSLLQVLVVLIYLCSLAGTALYLQQRSWWVGSTWRVIIAATAVGVAALVLMRTLLPIAFASWPWNQHIGTTLAYLAFDIGMLFAFSLIALRYDRNSSPLLPLVVLGLLCLFVADALYLILSWAPGGQPSQVAILPLYTLHSILLALAAYRDVTHIPTEPRHQPTTMPITEWLLWVLVPLMVMIAAFTAASAIGDVPLVLILALAVVGIAHEMLAMFDYRRVTSALYQARIEAEDFAAGAERNRVAGELHDNLTRYLTITNMQLQGASTLLSRNPDQARRSVQTAQQMTVKALTAVQQSVAALRNSPIDDRPLPEIIHDLAAESQLVDIHTEVIVVGDPHPLSMDTKAVLFRAAQEGLTNIRKHAHATHANLILDYSDSMCVRLVIQDNGQGGNPVSGGMGLAIMRERATRVGGKVGIDTTPGDGFTIEIEVPRCA